MKAEKPTVAAARSLRVLIVEDNLDAAEMLDMAVSILGHTTRWPTMAPPRSPWQGSSRQT